MKKDQNQLPQVAFSILLALSLKERHGYEIIKQVAEDSNGKITLGPGALYTSIKQLLSNGYIIEVSNADDGRRRYYKLTASGVQVLNAEIDYYEQAVRLAHQRRTVNSLRPHAAN